MDDYQNSVSFLSNYWSTLSSICHGDVGDEKGKKPMIRMADPARKCMAAKNPWQPPKGDWIKINTDGAYSETSGEAGIGVVIRNHRGGDLIRLEIH